MPALAAGSHRLSSHAHPGCAYREYLITSHAIVRASVPLMEAAFARAQCLAGDDPVSARLVSYLPEHIVEETDHDSWLLEDLESIAVDRSTVLDRPPSPRIAALVGAQYYWIHHYHPAALLGYMAVLEGTPPSLTAVEQMIERTGFDRRAFRTLIEHADIDKHHGDEVFGVIDELELTTQQSTLLGLSAMHTVVAIAAVIDEVVDRCHPGPIAPGRVIS